MQHDAELISLTTAAKVLGCSLDTVRRRVRAGELEGFRNGLDRRTIFVRTADLTQFRLLQRVDTPRKEAPPAAQISG